MNRELKFRAWDGTQMHQPVDILRGQAIKPGHTATFWTEDAKAGIVMQFTGLRDKNGKEIYEGDVVKDCFGQVNPITFGGGSFWFNWLEMPHYLDQVERGEVIGNIHENPELLEAP